MFSEHQKILNQVAALAGSNSDLYPIIKEICLKWSNGNEDNLLGVYQYLSKYYPDELDEFIKPLSYMVKVSK